MKKEAIGTTNRQNMQRSNIDFDVLKPPIMQNRFGSTPSNQGSFFILFIFLYLSLSQ